MKTTYHAMIRRRFESRVEDALLAINRCREIYTQNKKAFSDPGTDFEITSGAISRSVATLALAMVPAEEFTLEGGPHKPWCNFVTEADPAAPMCSCRATEDQDAAVQAGARRSDSGRQENPDT